MEQEDFVAKKIMIVEDNPVNQDVAMGMLEQLGCQVALATDGKDAVEMGETEKYDMVLMDMQMPIMGGVDATRSIREHETSHQLPATPIYAMTANVLPADKQACLSAGMNGHLGKPIKVTELTTLLNSLMKSGVP